ADFRARNRSSALTHSTSVPRRHHLQSQHSLLQKQFLDIGAFPPHDIWRSPLSCVKTCPIFNFGPPWIGLDPRPYALRGPCGPQWENIMTPEERQMLAGLFERVASTAATPRDPQAEAFIDDAVRANPHAPYVLAQTVLVQQQALENASRRLAELEAP